MENEQEIELMIDGACYRFSGYLEDDKTVVLTDFNCSAIVLMRNRDEITAALFTACITKVN